ncbi:MAG: hypothetical protein OXN18_09365 [Gemmatimonadota bacterium]|nr:hypothetical protein [Gemmatimonadota bacterium]
MSQSRPSIRGRAAASTVAFAAVITLSATTPQPLSPQQPSTVTDSAGVLIVFQVGVRYSGAASRRVSAVFRRHPRVHGRRRHIYAGTGIEPSIGRWNHDGTLSHLIRWATPERPVSDQDKRRYREANSVAPRYREPTAWARYLREVPFPERIPVYRRLILDAERNLWAERYRAPWEEEPSWYVFDEHGAWLGKVATPPGLHVFEIGMDYVLGRYRDEFDVQSVVMIPLDRGGGPGR